MKVRRNIPFIAALATVLLIIFVSVWFHQTKEPSLSVYRPPDRYGPSDEVSLNELTTFANNSNYTLYLPAELPANLELTAIYLKEGPLSVMAVYSAFFWKVIN